MKRRIIIMLGALTGTFFVSVVVLRFVRSDHNLASFQDMTKLTSQADRMAASSRDLVNESVMKLMDVRLLMSQKKLTAQEGQIETDKLRKSLLKAQLSCEMSLRYDLRNEIAWVNLSRAQFYLGDYRQAYIHARKGLVLFPENNDLDALVSKIRARL